LAVGGGAPNTALSDGGRHHHHHGHWHGHGNWHRHWYRRPIVYPPIVIGGYYPARYYYYDPYWGPYPYRGYYGSGIRVSVGW
jgi:hypothetical protein